MVIGGWCKHLKYSEADIRGSVLQDEESDKSQSRTNLGIPNSERELVHSTKDNSNKKSQSSSDIQIIGIASDEEERIARHSKDPSKLLPLVQIGWTEADCRKWCEENDLLSPIYTTATRGGCWFCHNQGINQLRLLRKNYPDLWQILLRWDTDSPVSFKADGITVHDLDERFQMEDDGIDVTHFRWDWVKNGIGGQYTFWNE